MSPKKDTVTGSVVIRLRVTRDLRRLLNGAAKAEGRTQQDKLRRILELALKTPTPSSEVSQ